MKIKEVCERTGLTDRAIRLYIESGLVGPKEEWSYTGRRAFSFSEDDVRTLENVATLRRADFSISDIAAMKEKPACIPDIVSRHQRNIKSDIESKQLILSTLEHCDCEGVNDYGEIADAIRSSACKKTLPKEDSGMNWEKIKCIVIKRISAILALVLLLIGLMNVGGLVCAMAFSETQIIPGGGYEFIYDFTAKAFAEHAVALAAVFVLFLSVVAVVCYLVRGRNRWLFVSAALVVGFVVLLLCVPGKDAERIYFFEFLAFRNALINTPFYDPRDISEWVIKLLKYVPVIGGAVFSVIGGIAASKAVQDD